MGESDDLPFDEYFDNGQADDVTSERGNDECFINCECLRETDKAFLIRFPDETERWVPKKQMGSESALQKVGDKGDLWISAWLAEKWREEPIRPTEQWVLVPNVTVLQESQKAIMIRVANNTEEMWLPKSQIAHFSEVLHDGDRGNLTCSKWIAEQKGL